MKEKIILRGFFEILLALILGGICGWLFFSLIGVVAVLNVDHKYYRWTMLLPRNYGGTAWWIHAGLMEFVSAIPVTLVTGVPLGILIRKSPQFYGFITFVGVFVFSVILYSIWGDSWRDIAIWWYPAWLGIIRVVFLVGLCILTTSLGYHIRRRRARNSSLVHAHFHQ